MSAVLGIDSSLSSTGLARITDDGHAAVRLVASTGHRDAPWRTRSRRIADQAARILAAVTPDTTLVVIEGPAYAVQTPGVWDRAGLWWGVVAGAWARGVPVAVVAPQTRAKWATTTGRADKAAVLAAMRSLWPDLRIPNHDAADALALAQIGAQRLGWPVPVRAWHAQSLDAVTWPQEVTTP